MNEETLIKQCIYESCSDLKEINKLIGYFEKLQQELTDYKERNKKAVEYIKLHRKTFSLGINEEVDEFDYITTSPNALLEILDKKEGK